MNKVAFRTEFPKLAQRVDWFPGHMRKAMRQLEDRLKKIDVFIEVRDARIPRTSINDELIQLLPQGMKRLVVYNKMDLVPERKTLELIKTLHSNGEIPFIHISTKEGTNIQKLQQFINQNCQPQFKTVGAWLMVGGVPNVGKSTIINALRKKDETINHTSKSGARTGANPGLTKSISGFKILADPPTYVVDTPGLIVPKIERAEDGLKLCACNCIRDGIVELETVCDYVLYNLNKQRQFAYVSRYALPDNLPSDSVHDVLLCAQKRLGLQDRASTQNNFLTDFRQGKLGKVLLD